MKRFSVTLLTGVVAALLLCNSSARADNLPWSYNWTPNTLSLPSDNPGTKLKFTNEPTDAGGNPLSAVSVSGNSDIVATQISVESNAPSGFPDKFTSTPNLQMKLKITDGTSGQSASFIFQGSFNTTNPSDPSTASSVNSNVKFNILSPTSFTQVIGAAEYTIKYVSYTPPPPAGSANKGSIAFHVTVTGLQIQKVPEPASMLLAGIGASFMGLGAWRKRRRQAATIETA
jgi:hypothetical protein